MSKPDWNAIKTAWLAREGNLRTLAAKFNVSFHTLAKRCKREGWTGKQDQLYRATAATVATVAMKTAMEEATKRGQEIGMTAASFVERSIRETEQWLNRIQSLADEGSLDAEKLSTLIHAWRGTIATGRSSFRLDEQSSEEMLVNVIQMSNSVTANPHTPLATDDTDTAAIDTPALPSESVAEEDMGASVTEQPPSKD